MGEPIMGKMAWFADATPLEFNPDEDFWHILSKRDADEEGGDEDATKKPILDKIKESPKMIKEEVIKDANILSEKTHIPTWGIFTIFAVIVLVVIGLIGWCPTDFSKRKNLRVLKTKREKMMRMHWS